MEGLRLGMRIPDGVGVVGGFVQRALPLLEDLLDLLEDLRRPVPQICLHHAGDDGVAGSVEREARVLEQAQLALTVPGGDAKIRCGPISNARCSIRRVAERAADVVP